MSQLLHITSAVKSEFFKMIEASAHHNKIGLEQTKKVKKSKEQRKGNKK